jgi:protein Tex
LLKKQLDETVESCVNFVGVDLNTASQQLLTFVSGINATVANKIVQYRNEHGAFVDRKTLLKVPKLGPKAYEQAAGFLRIRGGKNPLDNTAVHPERYALVATIAKDLGVDLQQTAEVAQKLQENLRRYVNEQVGEPTLRDIARELEKPGRDPRAAFQYATFREDIKEMRDLRVGLELEGVVTNVANFGAFVDIGVHQDGLVHVSQLADRFVSDPKEVVKVGQVVKVRVLEVNESLKRISLSMRSGDAKAAPAADRATPQKSPQKSSAPAPQAAKATPSVSAKPTEAATLADLQAKFGKFKR